MSDNEFDLHQERDRLSAEVARLRVERETGVPASLLSNATTEDEARAIAADALSWRGSTPAAPPSPATPAAAPAPQTGSAYGQVDRQALSQMNADHRSARRTY